MQVEPEAKILVVDDEEGILRMFRDAPSPVMHTSFNDSFVKLERSLFAGQADRAVPTKHGFLLSFSRQAEEAVAKVRLACDADRPFAVIFLDVRLPPGQNGRWAARRIREIDPRVNIVIITAFDDLDPTELTAEAGPPDKIMYLQKPVHPWEIRQFASALYAKWWQEEKLAETNRKLAQARKQLEEKVQKRTADLSATCARLEEKTRQHRRTADALAERSEELDARKRELEEANIALKVLLNNVNQDKERIAEKMREIDENLVLTIKEISGPYFSKLERSGLNPEQLKLLSILKKNLDNLADPALKRLYSGDQDLSPAEVQVANLIRQGMSNKEMAEALDISVRTVEFHRDNIRRKLGIKDRKTNLRTVLITR